MELSQRPTSTYSNVEPSRDTSIPINYNKDYNYGQQQGQQQFDKTFGGQQGQQFDKTFDKDYNYGQQQGQQQFDKTFGGQQQSQGGLLGSLPQQNQQLPAPPSSNFNQNLPQQQSIHIPVQSSNMSTGNVQPNFVPNSQSQGPAPSVSVPTAVPSQGSGSAASAASGIGGGELVSGSQEYSSLIGKLKNLIYGYDADYSHDPNFTAPLTLPQGIKTSITEIPEQLKKMLQEKEPAFDRDLPTKDFFKDLPEREVIRHRVVHPVQVQTIMHTVVHPPKKIEIRHAAPHEVVHEVVHEIPHEIHHVVQHQVPFEVQHIVEHQVNDNVKHVMRHGVHQMVNHEIKEEVRHNILHGINRIFNRGPTEAEIAEDNKIPHSVSRSAPLINQNITTKLIEDFSLSKGIIGGGGAPIQQQQQLPQQQLDDTLISNSDKGKVGILPQGDQYTMTSRTVDRSV